MTQERRRYGFVLERQCSLVKHCLAYHTNTQSMYDEHLNDWLDVAKSRERLPESVETMFATKLRVSLIPSVKKMLFSEYRLMIYNVNVKIIASELLAG